jgi:hypothetical protein
MDTLAGRKAHPGKSAPPSAAIIVSAADGQPAAGMPRGQLPGRGRGDCRASCAGRRSGSGTHDGWFRVADERSEVRASQARSQPDATAEPALDGVVATDRQDPRRFQGPPSVSMARKEIVI